MTPEITDRERSSVLADLGSHDDEIRRLAVERLGSLPLGEALPRLIERLGDGSWRVRKAAVARLVACGERAPVTAALIGALSDDYNPGRRNSAVEALVEIGAAVIPQLVDALVSDDVDVRKLLVDTMAGIGASTSRSAVISTLSDPDVNVRGAAAEALGVIGGEGAAEALTERAISDYEDRLVRLSALRSLTRLDVALEPELLSSVLEDSMLRPAGFALLGLCESRASSAVLLKGLASKSWLSCAAAIEALLRIVARTDGPESLEAVTRIREAAIGVEGLIDRVVERIGDSDLAQRLVLIQFLGLIAEPSCVVPILKSGRDEAIAEVAHGILEGMADVAETALAEAWDRLSVELRSDACHLLGRTSGDAGGALLLAALDDADSELRARAARALGERRCGDALPDLVRRLEATVNVQDFEAEEEQGALVEALVAMASGPDDDVAASEIELLASRLEGSGEDVRLAIASVLGRISRIEDAELVTSLLKDPSASVRRCAVDALARLEPGAASEPLRLALADESPLVRMAAASALGQSNRSEVLDDLFRLAHDEEARVRAATLRAVGAHCERQKDDGVRSRGLAVARSLIGDECLVAIAAVEALGRIGGREAAQIASQTLDRVEPELLQAAIACIGAHGDADAFAELLSLVPHPDWAVRAEAIQTLAERRLVQAVPPILRCLENEQDTFVRDTILRALKRLEE